MHESLSLFVLDVMQLVGLVQVATNIRQQAIAELRILKLCDRANNSDTFQHQAHQ
jgi:hypothetical protein